MATVQDRTDRMRAAECTGIPDACVCVCVCLSKKQRRMEWKQGDGLVELEKGGLCLYRHGESGQRRMIP
jgi:hypothetical protein